MEELNRKKSRVLVLGGRRIDKERLYPNEANWEFPLFAKGEGILSQWRDPRFLTSFPCLSTLCKKGHTHTWNQTLYSQGEKIICEMLI